MAGESYTGQRRRKQTPWTVRFGDAFVSRVIAVGGIGTIVAILLVVLVLLGTALPLFKSPKFELWSTIDVPEYREFSVNDSGLLMWGMLPDGDIEVRESAEGRLLVTAEPSFGDAAEISCTALSINRETLAVGFSDGTFRTAQIGFDSQLISRADLPAGLNVSAEKPIAFDDDTLYQHFDATGVRQSRLAEITWSQPRQVGEGPVVSIDYLADDSSSRFAQSSTANAIAICDGQLHFLAISQKKALFGGKVSETIELASCPLPPERDEAPLRMMIVDQVAHALVAWPSGIVDRFSLADQQPKLVESRDIVDGGNQIVSAAPVLARQTLVCGTAEGEIIGLSVIRKSTELDGQRSISSDEFRTVPAHRVKVGERPLVSLVSSRQSHVVAACDDQAGTALVYTTTDSLLATHRSPLEQPAKQIAFNPDGNILVLLNNNQASATEFDIGHPESSLKSYFGKVWYEGHDRPKYIWQSSAGTEKSEIKLSLMPLVIGTLKATIYAMLVSVPLAIMAAIYTSEFLSPSTRTRVKPIIELMASLPSVVLGYVAAMVVAPYLQEHLMAILACFLVVPIAFVFAGSLWNLLPVNLLVRLQAYRVPLMMICLPIAIYSGFLLAGPLEAWLFSGDLVGWLGRDVGRATGGWMLILLPLLTVGAALLWGGPLAEWSRSVAIRQTPKSYALRSLARLGLSAALVFGLAWLIGWSLDSAGLDLRGNFFNTYQDKNALLVGIALGFCVIPIIYTISDDALQAVPNSLRSASLGCGATPWQTTMRVVVPSAMSGLFSAVMIGLGRAVGETMVVLCAAGNTPVMEMNPFNGFRTLSATLATELPEAAKGSTHFRTLFLAALLLFVITLVANTLAEFVRMRFRKRASQL